MPIRHPFSAADLAIALLLASLLVAGYKLAPRLRPGADLTIAATPGCDLNAAGCAAALPDGARLELAISPRPIPLVQPLQVAVRLDGMVADTVDIDFAGATMEMGSNRQRLAPVGPGDYRGEAMLPVCATGRMDWVATVHLATPHRRLAVRYAFTAPAAR